MLQKHLNNEHTHQNTIDKQKQKCMITLSKQSCSAFGRKMILKKLLWLLAGFQKCSLTMSSSERHKLLPLY